MYKQKTYWLKQTNTLNKIGHQGKISFKQGRTDVHIHSQRLYYSFSRFSVGFYDYLDLICLIY